MNIIGGGLTGCVIASFFNDAIIYEKDSVGGLCKDNANYQEYVHVLHTNHKRVWDFVSKYTEVREHRIKVSSYVNGKYKAWPPREYNMHVDYEQMRGYNTKMWGWDIAPEEARNRLRTSQDGYFFTDKYQGIPNFSKFFDNITHGTAIVKMEVDQWTDIMPGLTVLTGPIDAYYGYCFGKLPYRGMASCHFQSELGMKDDYVSFPDRTIPWLRAIDYKRLGYGNWIGLESPGTGKHYPIRDPESEKIYNKYAELAKREGLLLAGRLATFHYQDMDECIEQAFNIVKEIKLERRRNVNY